MVKGSQDTQHKAVTLQNHADGWLYTKRFCTQLSCSSKTIGQCQRHFMESDKFSMVVMLCLYLVKVRFVLRNDLKGSTLLLRTVKPQLEGRKGFRKPPGKAWGRGTDWISHPGSEIHLCPWTEQTHQAELKYSDKNNKCPAFTCTVNISLASL